MIHDTEARVKSIVINYVESVGSNGEISTDMGLKELGINSISFIKIIVEVESEFDIEFDDEELDNNRFESLKDFILYIENKKTDENAS